MLSKAFLTLTCLNLKIVFTRTQISGNFCANADAHSTSLRGGQGTEFNIATFFFFYLTAFLKDYPLISQRRDSRQLHVSCWRCSHNQAIDWTFTKHIPLTQSNYPLLWGYLQNLLFVAVYQAETCFASPVSLLDYNVSIDSGGI